MAEIQNFGKHIGGSRADLWRAGQLLVSEIQGMSDEEVTTFVTRDSLWAREKGEDAVYKNNKSSALAYYQNSIRTSLPPKPLRAGKEEAENYAKVITAIKDMVMGSDEVAKGVNPDTGEKEPIQKLVFDKFCDRKMYGMSVNPEASAALDSKTIKVLQKSERAFTREASEKNYGLSKEDVADKVANSSYEIKHFRGVISKSEREKEYRRVSGEFNPGAYFEYDELYDETGKRHMEESGGEKRPSRATLTVPTTYGHYYFYIYGRDLENQPDKWQENSYFIVNTSTRSIVQKNMTLEEAENTRKACVEINKALQLQELENKQINRKKTGKQKFVPATLQNVIQKGGAAEISSRNITGDDMLDVFGFKGGEFGNWTNQSERQHNLNMCYNALKNLADVLKMNTSDIAFDENLSIAFGARGRGNGALAHYEPTYKVINLTKETTTRKTGGAGALAHEWGHALDAYLGDISGAKCTLLSDRVDKDRYRISKNEDIPESAKELIRALKYKKVTEKIDYAPKIEKATARLVYAIDSQKPDDMTVDQEKRWDTARNAIVECPLPSYMYSSPNNAGYNCLMDLSDLKKELTGRKLSVDAKNSIANCADWLHTNKWKASRQPENGTEREVETDLFQGSQKFDKMYKKEDKGYWASTCEMFARSFDCYIHDKLKEAGIQDDYLSAYSEAYWNSDDKGNKFYAFPIGEERENLNRLFDNLFTELHEKGYLHQPVKSETFDRKVSIMDQMPDNVLSGAYQQLSLFSTYENSGITH